MHKYIIEKRALFCNNINIKKLTKKRPLTKNESEEVNMSYLNDQVGYREELLATRSEMCIRDSRIMGWGSYLMLWLGGCISIGTLTMGSAQLDKGLNLMQVFLAVLIGSTILVIGICANCLLYTSRCV